MYLQHLGLAKTVNNPLAVPFLTKFGCLLWTVHKHETVIVETFFFLVVRLVDQDQALATCAGQIFHVVRVEIRGKALDVEIFDASSEDVSRGQFSADGLAVAQRVDFSLCSWVRYWEMEKY